MAFYVKMWAKRAELASARYGTLSSYSWVLMVVHFLQCGTQSPVLPNLLKECPEIFNDVVDVKNLDWDLDVAGLKLKPSTNNATAAELLIGFFDYYVNFNFDNWAISIRDGAVFQR